MTVGCTRVRCVGLRPHVHGRRPRRARQAPLESSTPWAASPPFDPSRCSLSSRLRGSRPFLPLEVAPGDDTLTTNDTDESPIWDMNPGETPYC